MNTFFSRLWIAVMVVSCLPAISAAAQWDASLSPALWQYRESMGATAGFNANTPLTSSATGAAMLMDVQMTQHSGAVSLNLGGEWLTSCGKQQETWQQPLQQQRNDVSMQHWELNAAAYWHTHSPLFAIGAWAALQEDTQKRSNFMVNGSAVAAALSREVIRASWAGISLMGDSEDRYFHLRLDAGMPLAVKTTNDMLPGTAFHTRQGMRFAARAHYRIWGDEQGSNTRMLASYRFRELGKEVQTSALWPKNRWQVFSLGLQQQW